MSETSETSRPPAGDLIFDVSAADFAERVIERSRQVPVLVDFWAAWCAPCRVLGPVLEKAVRDLGGRVLLAKLDTDQSPELARRYEIRGIPAVKAFRDGVVVDEFVGALDGRAVRAFLDKLAPSEEQQIIDRAQGALRGGAAAEAEALLRPLLGPGAAPRVPLLLGEALLRRADLDAARLAEAEALLASVDPRSAEAERAEALGRAVAFLKEPAPDGGEEGARARLAADRKDHEARFGLAALLARAGRHREALAELLEIVSRSRRFRDDGARLAMLSIFELLGPEHELASDFRHQLQLVL